MHNAIKSTLRLFWNKSTCVHRYASPRIIRCYVLGTYRHFYRQPAKHAMIRKLVDWYAKYVDRFSGRLSSTVPPYRVILLNNIFFPFIFFPFFSRSIYYCISFAFIIALGVYSDNNYYLLIILLCIRYVFISLILLFILLSYRRYF